MKDSSPKRNLPCYGPNGVPAETSKRSSNFHESYHISFSSIVDEILLQAYCPAKTEMLPSLLYFVGSFAGTEVEDWTRMRKRCRDPLREPTTPGCPLRQLNTVSQKPVGDNGEMDQCLTSEIHTGSNSSDGYYPCDACGHGTACMLIGGARNLKGNLETTRRTENLFQTRHKVGFCAPT